MSSQIRTKIRSLPLVPVNENGTGGVAQVTSVRDVAGRVVWERSPRGFISFYAYDERNGAMVLKIEDVDTADTSGLSPALPPGWTTPAGGGLNLRTDYEVDALGRQLKKLDPPVYIQLAPENGTTTLVRRVSYTLYFDASRESWSATGYATGTTGSYSFHTVGTVAIQRQISTSGGETTELIEAVRANNSGTLNPTEVFPQCRWRKWSLTWADPWGRVLEQRVYHKIPDAGSGSQGVNFEKREYGYDSLGRQTRVKDETGTISRTVYDVRGLITATWIGTDDTGATDSHPGGSSPNNMQKVLQNTYDHDVAGGDGELTHIRRPVNEDDDDDRIERYFYDYRGILEEVREDDGVHELITRFEHDLQGRIVGTIRYRDAVEEGHYLGKQVNHFDSVGNLYSTAIYGADEEGELTEYPVRSQRWYDLSGNVIKETGPNSDAAVKYLYDGIERNLVRYVVLESSEPPEPSSGSSSSSSGGGGGGGGSDSSSSSDSGGGSGSSSSSSGSSDSSSGSNSGSSSGSSSGSDSSSYSDSGSGASSSSFSSSSGNTCIAPQCCCPDYLEDVTETDSGAEGERCPDPPPCIDSLENSDHPIRYATGGLVYDPVDLSWRGFGFQWGVSRSYANQLDGSGVEFFGKRWLNKQMSYVPTNVGPSGTEAVVVTGANSSLWFRQQLNPGGWDSLFGGRAKLMQLPDPTEIELFLPDGGTKIYHSYDTTVAAALRGKIKAIVNRNAERMDVHYNSNGTPMQAAWSDGGRSIAFNYAYHSGTTYVHTVTQVLNGVNVRRVAYTYWQGTESSNGGSAGDLRQAVIEEWQPETSSWAETRKTFYRYYSSDLTLGFLHGLKMIFGPEACRRMAVAGINPVDVSDTVLLPYSDHYFEYNSDKRVTVEQTRGGTQTWIYDYLPNWAGNLASVNTWAMKTTETRPDGNQCVVYSNAGGKTLLHILRKVSDGAQWCRYREYNATYQTTLEASPSAIASVVEPSAAGQPLTVTLKANEGRVIRYDFEGPGSTAPSYLASIGVTKGRDGLRSILESYEYGEKPGTGARPLIAATAKIRDLGDGRVARTTFEYDYFGGGVTGSVPIPVQPIHIANSVANDTVFLQEESQYDPAGSVILATRNERFHDAHGVGPLGGPDATGETPKGRRAYTGIWPDAIGRTRVTADYGTNAGGMLVRAADAVAPAGSDIILVTRNTYKDDGDAAGVIDPEGHVTRWENDAIGRRIKLIENYVFEGTLETQNRTTLYGYHADSQLHTLTILTVLNSVPVEQVTTWHYGAALGDGNEIASNHLLREKEMADSGTYTFRYNRQGGITRHDDPNDTRHLYEFDPVGRLAADRVTPASGSHIDQSVLAIVRSYTAKGQLRKITCLDAATGGDVVNEVEFRYSPFGQLTRDFQQHAGEVDPATTPCVKYGYGSGTDNRIHLLDTTYPFTSISFDRRIHFDYGSRPEQSYRLGRVKGLSVTVEGALAAYQFAGLDRTVKLDYIPPAIDLSYISPSGLNGDDAGDPYTGWDRFGRTQDLRWSKGSTILDRTRYGYDRSSQRTWREVPLADYEDEAYQYHGLYQIAGRQRGELNTNHTAIGGTPVRTEAFNYDSLGNWRAYQASDNGSLAINQTRVHDLANTLTQIGNAHDPLSSTLLAHDPAGNMTLCPPPADGDWDEALKLVWDAWNRLVEVRSSDGATLIARYAYDGLLRRTTRKVGSGPVIHTYYNAQWRPLQETEENGGTPVLARTWDWGIRYRDDLIRRIDHLDDDKSNYALHDYYNVTAITDGSGAVLERYGYSAFGDVRFMTAAFVTKAASDHAWDLLYKAQFRDVETGFYNYGFRYLSPLLGRWLSRDPIAERGGVNLYGFVGNNGVNGTDLLGLEVWTFSGIRFGFWETNRNYVRDDLARAVESEGPPFVAANTGASKPEERMRDHPSASDKAFVFGLVLYAKTQLDAEAVRKAQEAVTEGQFCKACSKRKTKITLFMVAPKKSPQALPKTDCCDIAYIIYFDRRDIVPQGGIFSGWKDYWSGENVSAWEVSLAAPIHHGFKTNLELKHTPENERFSGAEVNLLDKVREASQVKDNVFVCHSQGCNIAIETLKHACVRK